MNLTGKCSLFVETTKTNDKTFKKLSISIPVNTGTKESAVWNNVRFEARFVDKLKGKEEKLEDKFCYKIDISSSFLGARTYTNKEGKNVVVPEVIIQDAKVLEKKEFERKEKPAPAPAKKASAKTKAPATEIVEDDDLPF